MTSFPSAQLDLILNAGHRQAHLILIAIAAFSGLLLILYDARSWKMDLKRRVGLLVVVFGGGLAGSAVPDSIAGNILQMRAEQCAISPKTIVAGLLFGFFGAAIYKRLLRIKEPTSDAFARGTCLMMAIGRIGCFVEHCCFGIATSAFWGVDFGDGVRRVPTQLIESAALWIGFVALQWLHKRDLFPDRRLFILFAYYGVVRFGVEFLREPLNNSFGPLQYYQWLSLLLAATGLFQIFMRSSHEPVRTAA